MPPPSCVEFNDPVITIATYALLGAMWLLLLLVVIEIIIQSIRRDR
jgi:hypothetical protein